MGWIRTTVVILVNTLIMLFIVNVILVYFSPSLIYKLGELHIYPRKIDKCYRTFLHDDLTDDNKERQKIVVVGDSFAEGGGDEFLMGIDNYGIVRKLDGPNTNSDYIVAGRGGYGNISAYNEAQTCLEILGKWTSWSYDAAAVDKVIFIFYEGNDLYNNIDEWERQEFNESLSAKRKRRILFPLFAAIRTLRESLMEIITQDNMEERDASQATSTLNIAQIGLRIPQSSQLTTKTVLNTTNSGIEIPRIIQAAATELDQRQLELSLNIVKTAIEKLHTLYPEAAIDFLYLPSGASSYQFDKIRIRTYRGSPTIVVDGRTNDQRSNLIRSKLSRYCESMDRCTFCDSTLAIRKYTSNGKPVHGPIDWLHFNASGYSVVADAYNACSNK